MTPYYDEDGITIYHGDCREMAPVVTEAGLILTDPPYPDYWADEYGYDPSLLNVVSEVDCRQLIFWSAAAPFDLDYTAIHIWDKRIGVGKEYERIFERNGGRNFKVFRQYFANSSLAAKWQHDTFTEHPSQKPISLIRRLIEWGQPGQGQPIVDPFMGSGTTLRAAKDGGYRAIGIETEERYCEIAVQRLAQGVLF